MQRSTFADLLARAGTAGGSNRGRRQPPKSAHSSGCCMLIPRDGRPDGGPPSLWEVGPQWTRRGPNYPRSLGTPRASSVGFAALLCNCRDCRLMRFRHLEGNPASCSPCLARQTPSP